MRKGLLVGIGASCASIALAVVAIAREMSPDDVAALPASKPILVENYGRDPLEVGELRLPRGKGPFPVAIVIHGGCWSRGFATKRGTAAMASALADKGLATWNIEYRQMGDVGAGWPGTFQDWGRASDHLRALARRYPIDLKRVIVVGHSAGAHAALFIASRPTLPRKSAIRGDNPLRVRAAVAIDGPGDLRGIIGRDAAVCGKPVVVPLMGGTPAEQPAHYAEASPIERLPFKIPQYLVASVVLTLPEAENYRAVAERRGDKVAILRPSADTDHFNIISPGQPQWAEVETFILRAVPR
jgi:acetyl esterase/lipase